MTTSATPPPSFGVRSVHVPGPLGAVAAKPATAKAKPTAKKPAVKKAPAPKGKK